MFYYVFSFAFNNLIKFTIMFNVRRRNYVSLTETFNIVIIKII